MMIQNYPQDCYKCLYFITGDINTTAVALSTKYVNLHTPPIELNSINFIRDIQQTLQCPLLLEVLDSLFKQNKYL